MNQEPWSATWLVDKAWFLVMAFVGFVWKVNDRQLTSNRKASDEGIAAARKAADVAMSTHQAQDDKEFKALHDEQLMQRGHIAKLFDRLEEHGRRSEERHNELMQRAHTGHIELLQAIHLKADK